MIILFPALICLVGLLIYIMCPDDRPRTAEIGKIMFWVGLLVSLLIAAPLAYNLIKR
jgi:uncharacterized membrane protein